ncbi:hypothetical protein L3X38_011410 [Prunus dulcis]|uniref:Retrotransposon gag domain-containing protein n=1 Tax=Prunus dulcis TaxID=3755 RepID=A0AAD4WJ13_PRUDU|nr:hypothetical protein L3X38_011410 [Prunus dulcis]
MRVFPYTLKDKAKYWLNSLKPGSLMTWGAIQKKFLEKIFLHRKKPTCSGTRSFYLHNKMMSRFVKHGRDSTGCSIMSSSWDSIEASDASREPGKWPSQTVINPKNQEAKAVHVLRSGKIVDNKVGSDLSNDVVVVEDEDEEETTAMEVEQPKNVPICS